MLVDMSEITVVICSTKTKEEYDTSLAGISTNALLESNDNIKLSFHENNTRGLSEVYNEELKNTKSDYLVFVHDDVYIHDLLFKRKLIQAHEQFDIVGLAGVRAITDRSPSVPIWLYFGSRDTISGFVAHKTPEGRIIQSSYGVSPASCIMMDGLFLSVKVKTIKELNITFDEDFDFHFYDSSFCLRAWKKGAKLGTYPIFVIHESGGKASGNWNKLKPIFINKYLSGDYI
jgi:GT2 family glycosyltransferase